MYLDFVILVLTTIVNLSLGVVVLLRSRRASYAPAFALMTLCICAWTTCSYLTNHLAHSISATSLCNQLSYLFGFAIVACGVLFTYNFPLKKTVAPLERRLIVGLLAFFLIFSVTSYVGGTVTREHGHIVFSNGPLLWLYIVAFLGTVCLIIRNLLSRSLDSPIERSQARLVLIAFSLTALLGLLFNAVIPALVSNWQSTRYGPLITVFLMAAITYSIVKQRLFDMQFALARSTAYFLAIGTVTIGYFLIIVFISHVFIRDISISLRYQLINVAIAVFVGLTFQPIKHFFDKITDHIFFRDGYDAQELLDNLNRLFVANTDLEQLLRQSAAVITDSFKAEFCFFGIKESDKTPQRIIGQGVRHVRSEDIELARSITPHIHHKVIVADELEDNHAALRDMLRANDIAILGRLTPSTNRTVEGLGYLVLGSRRSGNLYTTKDQRTLEIIVNELVIAIENSLRFEEIQHFNANLQSNVNEATRKLRRTNEKLQGLDATKDEFITMASHQLRTPLTAVKGYLSMVLEGDAGKLNAGQRKLLEQSYTSSQRMVYLIADLLNLSRLATGKFVIASSPTNLAEVVQAEIDQLVETARSREITLNYHMPANFPELMLDETKIHQVVMNFIDNAIYYTPAGGTIDVELRDDASKVEYLVHDSGIGVPKREQHHLFTKFYRAENARKARPDGTGLGLFMAKKVVTAQGGAIIFESEEGNGSTFGFRFSKRTHAVPTAKETRAVAK